MYIDVYKGDDNFVTSGATLLSDLDLRETYRTIDRAATGRIPSLFCDASMNISNAARLHLTSGHAMICILYNVRWTGINKYLVNYDTCFT